MFQNLTIYGINMLQVKYYFDITIVIYKTTRTWDFPRAYSAPF